MVQGLTIWYSAFFIIKIFSIEFRFPKSYIGFTTFCVLSKNFCHVNMSELYRNWNACHICRRDVQGISGTTRLNAKVEDAFEKSLILSYCRKREVELMSLMQVVWMIVIGAFASTENPCAAFISEETPRSIFRCQLQGGSRLRALINSIEIHALQTVVKMEDRTSSVDMSTEAALFDTVLLLCDEDIYLLGLATVSLGHPNLFQPKHRYYQL